MTSLDLVLLQFALACAVSVALGGVLWALLRVAARRWPVLAARRTVWVAAQLALMLPLAAAIVPRAGGPVAVPAIEIAVGRIPTAAADPSHASTGSGSAASGTHTAQTQANLLDGARAANVPQDLGAAARSAGVEQATRSSAAPLPESAVSARRNQAQARTLATAQVLQREARPTPAGFADSPYAERMLARAALAERIGDGRALGSIFGAGAAAWLGSLAWCWLAVYIAGVVWQAARVVRARAALQALLTAARPAADGVLEVDAHISPMLAGLRRPVVLIPAHLRTFTPLQQALIIEHERTHLRRRDPWLRAVRLAVASLCWFNPAAGKFGARLDWAQELGCDAAVLAGRPRADRISYAAALVAQLKLQLQARADSKAPHILAMAFGSDGESMASRIANMRAAPPAHGGKVLPAVLAAVGLLAMASFMLQPAFANQAPSLLPTAKASQAAAPWATPLDRMRVSSFFGVSSRLRGHAHDGIDIAARRGTPVHAPADGVVEASTDRWQNQAKYGKVIVLRHDGDMQTFYAHLDRRSVKAGQRVAKGDIVGYTGATGRVTGPHLHFEVWDRGAQVDPETVLGSLTANATANALKGRAAR